jgi:hypothetical protein
LISLQNGEIVDGFPLGAEDLVAWRWLFMENHAPNGGLPSRSAYAFVSAFQSRCVASGDPLRAWRINRALRLRAVAHARATGSPDGAYLSACDEFAKEVKPIQPI